MQTDDRLIIFTRYPQPGRAKTRLIPALGAIGAADLHRQMAEHTLTHARHLQVRQSASVQVMFTGGTLEQLQDWLGDGIAYQEQPSGDLGDRLSQAFYAAFAQGDRSVVIIGTDCPDLTAELLQMAFRLLQSHDLVLGPAIDGGYYLVGLRQFIPELFAGIAWSTDAVLKQTMTIADALGLTIATLPTLADVDRPEDLSVWEAAKSNLSPVNPKLSVIVPTLDNASQVAKTLAPLATDTIEVIVVAGRSQDEPAALLDSPTVKIIHAQRGRALQMNAGATAACGDVLLFLHGDTRLPRGFEHVIHQVLSQTDVVAGAFELQIDAALPGLRLVEWGVKWRSRLLQMPYGDQALFLKATIFHQLGGFPELPLMEDFEFVRRLRRLGRIAIAPAAVLTSGRRWQAVGVLQTTLINQCIIAAYFLGVPPDWLARWYGGRRRKEEG